MVYDRGEETDHDVRRVRISPPPQPPLFPWEGQEVDKAHNVTASPATKKVKRVVKRR